MKADSIKSSIKVLYKQKSPSDSKPAPQKDDVCVKACLGIAVEIDSFVKSNPFDNLGNTFRASCSKPRFSTVPDDLIATQSESSLWQKVRTTNQTK
jgi:hypothetical protein